MYNKTIMKKMMNYLLIAATVCGISLAAVSCSKDDDNDIVPPVEEPDDNGANSGGTGIGYIKRSWDEAAQKVVDEPLAVNAEDIRTLKPNSWHSGAKYISGSYTIDGYLGADGGTTLDVILCDGAEFKVKGLRMKGFSTLRIFGQEKGTGKLVIEKNDDCYPGIGGIMGVNIEIHGGIIETVGDKGAAGIGAGFYLGGLLEDREAGYFSSITIYGGNITAQGGDSAAGIGGCYLRGSKADGDINIYGGTIIAKGGGYYVGPASYGGAGIGGGYHNMCRHINIWGGIINATGGSDAAGIGCGESADTRSLGEINIHGGTIVAQGADYAAGIGGGDCNEIESINISGGIVYAYAGKDGAGIGGGEDGRSGNITITGGMIRAYGDRNSDGKSIDGYGAGIGSGQNASVNTIIIKGGDIEAYGGKDAAGIGTGEEYGVDLNRDINSGTIEIHGGKVFAQGKGYGAGIGCGEDATFGVLGISGGRVDAHAGSDCGPWSGGIGAYHKDHGADDNCHIGWAGWQRIYIGAGMRLWTYSPNVGGVENVTNNLPWWNYVHQRPQVAFGECDHQGYTEATCPFCYRETLQLR